MEKYRDVSEPLTKEKLEEAMNAFKTVDLVPAGKKGFFEKLMNKLGWYREAKVFCIRERDLNDIFMPTYVRPIDIDDATDIIFNNQEGGENSENKG